VCLTRHSYVLDPRVLSSAAACDVASTMQRALVHGAPWCEKCKQQKAMLFGMIGPAHWKDHYSDCGGAKCCLGCTKLKNVPMWKVNGTRYGGRFDQAQLASIVGAQKPGAGGSAGRGKRAAAAAARGDALGGWAAHRAPSLFAQPNLMSQIDIPT